MEGQPVSEERLAQEIGRLTLRALVAEEQAAQFQGVAARLSSDLAERNAKDDDVAES